MLAGPSSQSITIKLVMFFLLLLVDIVLSSFVEASFTLKVTSDMATNTTFIPVQLVIAIALLIMILIMMWQTFLLRHGLLGILFREFLANFLVAFVVTGISIAERIIRLIYLIPPMSLSDLQLWDRPQYQALYYLRYLSYPLFYGALIDLAVRLARPEYYKANKWLK